MKRNMFKSMLGGICLATMLMAAQSAKALLITVGSTLALATGNQNGNAAILAIIQADPYNVGPEIYKDNKGGSEEGAFATSYSTTYGDPNLINEDFTITFGGGNKITADPVYLLVKDGNASPNWYLYDISGWNGTEVIQGEGFFPEQGGISHVAIYGLDDGFDETPVPDGGTTIALLGLVLVGADMLRRKLVKA